MSSYRPYKRLGLRLQSLRKMVYESISEVAGSLELDPKTLEKIEQGVIRPSEDVLLLLVSHFGVKEEEAAKLWDIAGYTPDKPQVGELGDVKPMLMVLNDPRIVYSDSMHIAVNNYGVVMNFVQNSGAPSSSMSVARIGMSREHAQSILKLLEDSLKFNPSANLPKKLPAPKNPNNNQ